MNTRPPQAPLIQGGPVVSEPPASRLAKLRKHWKRWRSSAVVPSTPEPPTPANKLLVNVSTLRRRSVAAIDWRYLSFREAFGVLGLPMVVVALVCISWTVWLIVLTIAPNKTANYLMNTAEFDDGQFWLIPEELTMLQIFTVLGLVVVALVYIYVLLKMLVSREYHHAEGFGLDRLLQRCKPTRTSSLEVDLRHRLHRMIWGIYVFLTDLTGFRGKHRKRWNVCLKVLDLTMQAFILSELLEAGTPVSLTIGFAAFAALNSLVSAIEIVNGRCTAFAEILIDSLLDWCAAVLFPMLLLVYSVKMFDLDRAVQRINMEVLPVGSFERRARMLADPIEIERFLVSFESLRIRTAPDLFLRIGLNLGFSHRFKRVVEVLIQLQTQRQRDREKRRKSSVISHQPTLLEFPKAVSTASACQRVVPRSLSVVFLAYSMGVVLATYQSISVSQATCSSHPECIVFAYRWRDSGFCPCRALVDGNRAPMTYFEWTHPVDITATVKSLAASGTLKTLQLVNRQLKFLPDELRTCHNLHFISLINCETEELPTWGNELRKLQYLQVDGKVGSDNLVALPSDLFSDMPELRYLQLGLHQRMVRLPQLDGVPNLISLTLARMKAFTELPSFSRLESLQRLEFSVMPQLARIPDLQPVGPLVHLAVYQGASLCCNGFLGSCDLTNQFCTNATCLNAPSLKATPATLRVMEKFSVNVCQPFSGLSQTPTAETIQMCDGVPNRQCSLPGLEPGARVMGICYNHRMQVLACNPDAAKIQVRRRQIQEGVGLPCDAVEEAWLGCMSSTLS